MRAKEDPRIAKTLKQYCLENGCNGPSMEVCEYGDWVEADEAIERIAELEDQRDALLEACEAIVLETQNDWRVALMNDTTKKKLREAIAKAKEDDR